MNTVAMLLGVALLSFSCGASESTAAMVESTARDAGAAVDQGTPGALGDAVNDLGTTGADGAGLTFDTSRATSFCRSLIGLAAETEARCVSGSVQTWLRLFNTDYECQHVAEAEASGRIVFDSTKTGACVNARRPIAEGAPCSAVSEQLNDNSDCLEAIRGTVQLGGACKRFHTVVLLEECAGDAYCDSGRAQSACGGTCTAYLKQGEACDALKRCGAGLVCNQTCTPLGVEGAACGGASLPSACATGLYCTGSRTNAGSCALRKTSGSCSTGTECARSLVCDATGACSPAKIAGAMCNPGLSECGTLGHCTSDGTCAASLPSVGEPCGTISGEFVFCEDGYCDAPAKMSGVCQPKRKRDQACLGLIGECEGDYGQCDATTKKCTSCEDAPH